MGAEGRLSASGDLMLTSPNVAVAATAVDSSNFQGLMLTANASVYGAFQEGDVSYIFFEGARQRGQGSSLLPRSEGHVESVMDCENVYKYYQSGQRPLAGLMLTASATVWGSFQEKKCSAFLV